MYVQKLYRKAQRGTPNNSTVLLMCPKFKNPRLLVSTTTTHNPIPLQSHLSSSSLRHLRPITHLPSPPPLTASRPPHHRPSNNPPPTTYPPPHSALQIAISRSRSFPIASASAATHPCAPCLLRQQGYERKVSSKAKPPSSKKNVYAPGFLKGDSLPPIHPHPTNTDPV